MRKGKGSGAGGSEWWTRDSPEKEEGGCLMEWSIRGTRKLTENLTKSQRTFHAPVPRVYPLLYSRASFNLDLPCHRASFHSLELIFFLSLPPSLFLPYSHSKTLLQIYRVYFRPDSVPVPDFARNITRILSSPRRFLFVPNFNNLGRAKGKKKRRRNIRQEAGSEAS